MPPKFKDNLAYQQAEILMQPTFIRVIDNIRKESEKYDYKIDYQEKKEPFPSYLLCISKDNQKENLLEINIWDICFQICFIDYEDQENKTVEIDINLFDENQQLDWDKLEAKTQIIIQNIFSNLGL